MVRMHAYTCAFHAQSALLILVLTSLLVLFFSVSFPDKDYLAKLGKGQIVSTPIDLTANRAKKRNRFMPMTKDEIAKEEQQAHRPQPTPNAIAAAASAAAFPSAAQQLSPKLNRPNVYASSATAAHQQAAAAASNSTSHANPYLKPPQQQSPQQHTSAQFNSPVVKHEMSSPVIHAHQNTAPQAHSQRPTNYHAANTTPNRPNATPNNAQPNQSNQWAAPPTNGVPAAGAPTSSFASSVWPSNPPPVSAAASLPLQSNFAQQNLINHTNNNNNAPSTPYQPQQHQSNTGTPYQPQPDASMHTPAGSHAANQFQPRPYPAGPTATLAVNPNPNNPSSIGVVGGYTPPSSFGGGAASAAAAPNSASVVSKLDPDLDDDLLLNIIDHHSPQKTKEQTNAHSTVQAQGVTATSGVNRQLRLEEQKENRAPSVNCSPASSASQQKQPSQQKAVPNQLNSPLTDAPNKSPIFTVADLLDDHEREQNGM